MSVWGTRFPLFCLRTDRIDGNAQDAMRPIWSFICWSLNSCYIGKTPVTDVNGKLWTTTSHLCQPGSELPFRARLWELRGDWKWHHQTIGMRSTWMSQLVCHQCGASKTMPPNLTYADFRAEPQWLHTVRDHDAFIRDQLPADRLCNPILYAIGFDYRSIRWCSMHAVNLGIGLHANGGCFHELLAQGYFPGETETIRFSNAFREFRTWCRSNQISCSQSMFKPYMFVTKGDEYCYFQTKDPCIQTYL